MSTLSAESLPRASSRPRLARAVAVAAAVAASIVLWAIMVKAADEDLRAPAFRANQMPSAVSLGAIVGTVLVAGLLAWLAVAVIERVSSSPRRHWTALAVVAAIVSLGGPLHGISAGDRASLAAFHLLTAAVLIPLLARSTARN